MEKMSRAERARQFMPFSPLRGYDELLLSKTREPTPKRELSEYDAARLSKKMAAVEKGSLVRVTYYDRDAYVTMEGLVSEVDLTLRRLRVIKTVIDLDDISDITKLPDSK